MMHHELYTYTADVYDRAGTFTGRITFRAEDNTSANKIESIAEFIAEGESGFCARVENITRVGVAA